MSFKYLADTPEEVKNSKGLHLMTTNTPNGQKVQIFLEELQAKYGGPKYDFNLIKISTNEQKKDWFLAINPNGRIPVIIDNTVSPPFAVHETSAELVYLQSKFDKDNEFGFTDELEKAELFTWLFFWHGSGAPYQGNTNYFLRQAERSELAITRFKNETLRVFGVLEIRLSGKYTEEKRDYLAGKVRQDLRFYVHLHWDEASYAKNGIPGMDEPEIMHFNFAVTLHEILLLVDHTFKNLANAYIQQQGKGKYSIADMGKFSS
jgi:glutathione S-transferase